MDARARLNDSESARTPQSAWVCDEAAMCDCCGKRKASRGLHVFPWLMQSRCVVGDSMGGYRPDAADGKSSTSINAIMAEPGAPYRETKRCL